MCRVISFLIFLSQISQKQTQIFNLTIETTVFSMCRSKNHFVAYFSALKWFVKATCKFGSRNVMCGYLFFVWPNIVWSKLQKCMAYLNFNVIFLLLSIEKQQCTIFSLIEPEHIGFSFFFFFTHTTNDNYMCRVISFMIFLSQTSQKQTQIFNSTNKHYCPQHVQVKKSFCKL